MKSGFDFVIIARSGILNEESGRIETALKELGYRNPKAESELNTKELQGKSETELQHLLSELRLRLAQLRFDMSSGKVKNIREVRDTKKVISRILTMSKTHHA